MNCKNILNYLKELEEIENFEKAWGNKDTKRIKNSLDLEKEIEEKLNKIQKLQEYHNFLLINLFERVSKIERMLNIKIEKKGYEEF